MNKKYTSNAKWSKIDDTRDVHFFAGEAESVCDALMRNYTKDNPCDVRGVCLKAWVEKLY